jgi:hypothetical protein
MTDLSEPRQLARPHAELGAWLALVAVMTAPWLILFVTIPPGAQDFPLNDDWAFSKGAFAFAQGEGIHYQGWASMPLLGQWLWAWPFIQVFGPAHAALRLSTILASWVAILAFFDLLRREVGLPAMSAAFTAAALALNPGFLLLADTFMTDVPALAFSLAALALYRRALDTQNRGVLLAAAVAATIGAVTRQSAVVAPASAALLLWRDRALARRPLWNLGVVLPVAAGVAVALWFNQRADVIPRAPQLPNDPLTIFKVLPALGLAILPAAVWAPVFRPVWRLGLALVVTGGAAAYLYAVHGLWFPYRGDWLPESTHMLGFYPLLLPLAGQWLTFAGAVGSACLLVRLVDWFRTCSRPGALALYTLLQLPLLAVAPVVYDRYLVVLLPGALAVTTATSPPAKGRQLAGLAMLVLYGALGTAVMHDWLAWNSARWQLGREAVSRGIPATDIEGGFEWDGYYSQGPAAWYEASQRRPNSIPRRRLVLLPVNAFAFPEITGRYALAFSVPAGLPAEVVASQPYSLWLTPGRRAIYVLKYRPG